MLRCVIAILAATFGLIWLENVHSLVTASLQPNSMPIFVSKADHASTAQITSLASSAAKGIAVGF
jgi:hypothetical protein